MIMQKEQIRRAFSKAADHYESLSAFHQQIACQLLQRIDLEKNAFFRVLDIGMGTGWLTKKICDELPQTKVFGMDFSQEMLHCAEKKNNGFFFVQGDANNLPFRNHCFDLIVSNLSYQWVENLTQAFHSCYKVLKDEGKIVFSLFGHNTFKELFESLETSFKDKHPQRDFVTDRLVKEKRVFQALSQSGFKNIEISSTESKMVFEDMIELIKWIKGIGANALSRDFFVGKELLMQANTYYKNNFREQNNIFASLEVIWVEAKK